MKKHIYESAPEDVASTIRMPLELKEKFVYLAKRSGRSFNREIVYRLVHSIETHPDEITTGKLNEIVEAGYR